MKCPFCLIGWHHRCKKPAPVDVTDEGGLFVCCCDQETPVVIKAVGAVGRPQKENSTVKDPTSTGRKRAVLLKKIDKDNPGVCEWAYLKSAGGGVEPIVGCTGNTQTNVHHGPDKDTLNNEDNNLHAICATCHNRWHAKNDKYYGKRPEAGLPFLPVEKECIPHDPNTKISLDELLKVEGERKGKK